MSGIARWTTPAITFKPSAVEVAEVDEIWLVLSQNGNEVLFKTKEDATISEENGFVWILSQQDTAKFCPGFAVVAQIDYLAGSTRYTVNPVDYGVTNSAKNEVMT